VPADSFGAAAFSDGLTALADHGCEDLVARFVGFPSWQRFDNPDVGYFELGFEESQWNMGDRSVPCSGGGVYEGQAVRR
jgi:hypothetical protein